MHNTSRKCQFAVAVSIAILLGFGTLNAQTQTAWGYSTGYGNVYGSFGLASTMQSMYNVARSQMLKRSGSTTASPASRPKPLGSSGPAPSARKSGVFRPDASVDTGKALADALGDTPDVKALIKQVYAETKTGYEKEAAAKGWSNNIAGGLTFFTLVAVTVYHDGAEPDDASVTTYYDAVNASLDELPGLASVSDKDKQNYNNMLIGFGGILLAGQVEGKQTGNKTTIDNYKKLAGMLITMVLKTEPENLRVENGQIVLK